MPGKRHSAEEIEQILKEWLGGMTIEQVMKKHKVSAQSLYRWKRQVPAISQAGNSIESISSHSPKPQTLNELRAENIRLKAVIAELLMEKYNTTA